MRFKVVKQMDKYIRQDQRLEGFMDISLVDRNTNEITYKQHNEITNLGKLLYLSKGPSEIFMSPSGEHRGRYFVKSSFGKLDGLNNVIRHPIWDEGFAVYLANIDNSGLTAASRILPLYNGFSVDESKIIGVATFERSVIDAKKGVIVGNKGTHLVGDRQCVRRWRFDSGNANGEFNTILLGSNIRTKRFNGLSIHKGIFYNLLDGSNPFDFYCMPGVSGLTASNEILVGSSTSDYSINVGATHVLNLDTGDITLLEATDERYGVFLGKVDAPQVLYNGAWYRGQNDDVMRRDLTTGAEIVADQAAVVSTLFEYNGYIYVTYINRFVALNATTLEAEPAQDILFSSLTLPSEIKADDTLHVSKHNSNFYYSDPTNKITIVSSDLLNVSGNITEFMPSTYGGGWYTVGSSRIHLVGAIDDDYGACNPITIINNATATQVNGTVKISYDWFGNMLSYIKLTSPIVKTSEQIMYVSWGIKYV